MSTDWFSPPHSFAGIEVWFAPHMLRSSTSIVMFDRAGRSLLIAWSREVLELLIAWHSSGLRFEVWHDSSSNCRTWTDAAGCRCEVEP